MFLMSPKIKELSFVKDIFIKTSSQIRKFFSTVKKFGNLLSGIHFSTRKIKFYLMPLRLDSNPAFNDSQLINQPPPPQSFIPDSIKTRLPSSWPLKTPPTLLRLGQSLCQRDLLPDRRSLCSRTLELPPGAFSVRLTCSCRDQQSVVPFGVIFSCLTRFTVAYSFVKNRSPTLRFVYI